MKVTQKLDLSNEPKETIDLTRDDEYVCSASVVFFLRLLSEFCSFFFVEMFVFFH
jgi:hypothetical protein